VTYSKFSVKAKKSKVAQKPSKKHCFKISAAKNSPKKNLALAIKSVLVVIFKKFKFF
jgi:hypothetical protein